MNQPPLALTYVRTTGREVAAARTYHQWALRLRYSPHILGEVVNHGEVGAHDWSTSVWPRVEQVAA